MTKENMQLPLLPLRGLLVFPSMVIHLDVGRAKSIAALEKAMMDDQEIFLAAQKKDRLEEPEPKDIYSTGTLATVKQMIKLPNGTIRVLVEGLYRGEIVRYVEQNEEFVVEIKKLEDIQTDYHEEEALMRSLLNQFEQYIKVSRKLTHETFDIVSDIEEPGRLADMITSHLSLKIKEKQELLETTNVKDRLKQLVRIISNEKKVLDLEKKIGQRVKTSMEKTQKEFYLREQLKAIQKELGEKDGKSGEVSQLKEKIDQSDMPDNIRDVAWKELDRYEKVPQSSAESSVIRNYLEWLLSLPWTEKTQDTIEIEYAEEILDRDHYGLDKVKERILEYLAVQKLTNSIKGPILCLVGPPGVGKTSLAKSIARSINRNFVRISLGGVRDEAEIRGHRRTYIGAMPGRIIQGMKKAKTVNPVFLLDEIDKMSNDFRGDPSSAMLEVLDPEQNSNFSDHFIEETYDLSNVLFVATANYVNNIPEPLLDRMELISIAGYTEVEKQYIAKQHLLPKQLKENGLKKSNLQIRDDALLKLIRTYTREAGVRNLERQLATLCRKAAKIIISEEKKRVIVTNNSIETLLGKPLYRYGLIEQENQIGTATGLAYTAAGGDTLSIEVSHYPGKGKLTLTGKLGDVMQESAQAAFSYIRSRSKELNIDPSFHENSDIHIHVPEGATPKDGPSAGITMATALVSALTGRAVKKEVGMTGEITLRGRVLPIGGLKEKSLSAHRAGITTIIIPEENEKDIESIPESVRNDLRFIPVRHLDQVLEHALVGEKNESNKR
ncbi:endopeptidase La [Virgibacillus sp. AGTR]|uniref:endopeptidase La n=1 Tax=unclassified Virgibacillus TaxID=2620237 RepID=UPI00041B5353|nr:MULTISPECIES: endopeptidase La [Bacillaceae]MCC2252200.1 endopeptidase La [Virgibacillus sp. AGTR]MDY7046398.1 endopeptidase La [Virgibacillus sp. M23]QRZ17610.1 endopeptidase La [Virgibacillus sp. AGTR]